MIVGMKSITVMGLASHVEAILNELRQLGVLHIRHVKQPEGASLDALGADIDKTNEVLNLLPAGEAAGSVPDNASILIDKLSRAAERLRQLREELNQLGKEAEKVGYLGEFNPADIGLLKEKGIHLTLHECEQKKLPDLPSEITFRELSHEGGKATIAVASYPSKAKIELNELPVPRRSVGQVEEKINQVRQEAATLEKEIHDSAKHKNALQDELCNLIDRKNFEGAKLGMGNDESVIFMKGFCPDSEIDKVKSAAKHRAWGLAIDEPGEEDEPPTLLKNPAWVKLVKPVFAIINTVPGYREFDISMWFLLFFSIFFAMLIGDAGYGFIFLAMTLVAQVKVGKKMPTKEPFYLMYVLSICTIGWGMVTGNWLGVEALSNIRPFNLLVVQRLNAYSSLSQTTVMNICFVIGVIQLSIGHLIVAFRYINSVKAIAQIGWIGIMWGIFFLARNLVLGTDIPFFFKHLLIGGAILVVLFSNPQKNMMKGILLGIADLPMSMINAFADNMSYIRLFAVGMATIAVAQSFNEIGMDVGFGNVFTGLAAALILAFGHTLNIILAAMAVIVHGVRLNMLEFSGHVGNTWSGYEYEPFKKTKT